MGLSNGERNKKVIWSVHRVTELAKEIDDKEYPSEDYTRLKQYCDELWYEMWGKSGNSAFWLFGSDDKVTSDGTSTWSVALYDTIAFCDKEEKEPFEKSILEEMCSMEDLIECYSKRDGKVYLIYQWIQNVQYAANRYQDELSAQYAGLMKACSKIYGQCLTIFKGEFSSEKFALGYVMRKVAEILYKDCSPRNKAKWDCVTKYLVEDHAHHEIRNPFKNQHGSNLIHAKAIWKSLYQDGSAQNRLYCFLDLSGEKYEHKWTEVMNLVKKNRWNKKKFEELKARNLKWEKEKNDRSGKEHKEESDYYTKEILGLKKD